MIEVEVDDVGRVSVEILLLIRFISRSHPFKIFKNSYKINAGNFLRYPLLGLPVSAAVVVEKVSPYPMVS